VVPPHKIIIHGKKSRLTGFAVSPQTTASARQQGIEAGNITSINTAAATSF